jgi:hypothetical protein
MAVPRLGKFLVAVAMGFVPASAAVPARGQNPTPVPPVSRELAVLRAQVAALSRRVAKLEGQIVAADLVGTYQIWVVQTELIGGNPARISTQTTAGTIVLAADGTGSASLRSSGVTLIQGSPWSQEPIDDSGEETFTWTYADGTVEFSDGARVSVAAGGRVLVYVSQDNFHSELGIATRL